MRRVISDVVISVLTLMIPLVSVRRYISGGSVQRSGKKSPESSTFLTFQLVGNFQLGVHGIGVVAVQPGH